MANETASLVIKVDSSGAARATSELDRLGRAASDAEGKVGLIPGAFKLIGTVAASATVGLATRAFIAMADESANLRARLRLATDGVDEFNTAQRATYEIAQRSSTELGSVVDLYAKLAQSTGQLGVSQESLLQLTESITQTFQISGASAQEASGGLRQLSQAMAGGVLRAEEFNSIIESSPRLVQAMADGMGIAFGDVRKYVNEGKISSEILVQALLSQTDAIQSEFDQMPITVGRAMQQVRNALTGLVGDADSAEGASRTLAEAIAEFARTLESEEVKNGFATFVSGLSDVVSWAAQAGTAIDYLNRSRQAFAGVREQASSAIRGVGFLLTGQMDRAGQEWRAYQGASSKIDGAFAPGPAPAVAAPTATGGIADFAKAPIAPGERPTAAPGGGTGKPAREKISDEDRALAALQRTYDGYLARLERVNALHGDNSELAAVNYEIQLGALQGISDEEARALRLAAERNDAQKAAADQRSREWEAFADDMRALEGVWDEIAEQSKGGAEKVSEYYKQAARNIQTTFADFLFDPLADGFSGMADRFADAVRRMAADLASSKLLEAVGAWASGYSGAGAGWVNAIGGALKGGRAFGGPVQAGQSYRVGERGRPEIFTPSTSGRITPMGGGQAQVVNRITINEAPPGTRAESTPNSMGGFDMTVIIGQIEKQIGGNIAQGSGAAYSGMKGRFNLKDAV